MFTSNFFIDNSQLNFGKHFTHKSLLKKGDRKRFEKVIEAVAIFKRHNKNIEKSRVSMYRSLGLLLAMALVVFAFEWKTYDTEEKVTISLIETNTNELLDIPVTVQPTPPPPPKLMAVNIVSIPKEEEIENEIEINFDIETNEEMVIEEMIYDEVEEIEEEKVDEVFLIVEKVPVPVGGLSAFYKYVGEEINYPSAAIRARIDGKVFVQFIVNKDGSLSDFEVVKGVGLGCDEEAVRVLKKAPKWIPGKQRGKNVRVKMVLPIHFIIKSR
ncbi:MAG: energy transducer TonB [Cyclobacteriaceae bacterium]|nr:energy transducer TonB [Cyclobacteriaceae bacterium]